MAYRRRQQVGSGRADFAFDLDTLTPAADSSSSSSSASSLAAKAIRASAAYRDSSLSSVYEQSALSSPRGGSPPSVVKDSSIHEHSPKKNVSESRQGFWGVLAQKAKSILDDDVAMAQQHDTTGERVFPASDKSTKGQFHGTYESQDGRQKKEGPKLQKGLNAIASSLNYIGGTIGNALEEGITRVENRTADIIQETRKIQIRKRSGNSGSQNQTSNIGSLRQQHMMQANVQPQMHADLDTQLKASRDVAMAMAAKAKLLLRELKTVKADLAFAKERCHQLEEENKILRESHEKGGNLEDDDLIRLQLESLLAEKARLAQENSVFARENRFLREIVEYHQLTMQDVVYLDEGSEEVTEVYPIKIATATQSFSSMSPIPPPTPTPTIPQGAIPQAKQSIISSSSLSSQEPKDTSLAAVAANPYIQMPTDVRRY